MLEFLTTKSGKSTGKEVKMADLSADGERGVEEEILTNISRRVMARLAKKLLATNF